MAEVSKKLVWDQEGERFYETGVSKGVLYPYDSTTKKYGVGVAWNGLTGVNENPSGGDTSSIYADNIKYLNLMSKEDFGATIEAYTYPDEFEECDGVAELASIPGVTVRQQRRKKFGFSYQTLIGNDTDGTDLGYKIHLVYNCLAKPSSKSRSTTNESPEAMTLSWELTTTPMNIEGMQPTACIDIDSRTLVPAKLKLLEDKLYGTETTEPTLPTPAELVTLLKTE